MTTQNISYHKTYALSADDVLTEIAPSRIPLAGSIAAQVDALEAEHKALNERLLSLQFGATLRDVPPIQAGIYPLKVTHFECSSEGNDADGMCLQITSRLGNLQVIKEVPFMRKGNVIFAIGTQGLVDPESKVAGSVDAVLGCRVLWRGILTESTYAYELIMFRSGKDKSIARMTETIDLTQKLADIDPNIYQAEVAYHLNSESKDHNGELLLTRTLSEYGRADEFKRVQDCYLAAEAFNAAVRSESGVLSKLAKVAHSACALVPRKRYYQAYDAFLQNLDYPPR